MERGAVRKGPAAGQVLVEENSLRDQRHLPQGRDFHCSVDAGAAADGAAWSLACAEATTVPAATGTAVAGAGVSIGLGNCEISMAEPEGTNLAGSLPVALPVASLTGIPLSRSGPDAEAVAAAAVVETAPAA